MTEKSCASYKFEKKCCITFHNNETKSQVYELDQRRYVTKEERTYVQENQLIIPGKNPNRKLHICELCLEVLKSKVAHPSKRIKSTAEQFTPGSSVDETTATFIITDDAVRKISYAFENGTLTDFQSKLIFEAVGRRLNQLFSTNKPDYRSCRLDNMKASTYVKVWEDEQNKEWKTILTLTCGLKGTMDTSACRRLTKCTELIRSQLDNNFISNLALGEALLLMQFSHSKYAVDIFCRTNAAGSFSTVRRTLSRFGENPFALPEHDVAIAFDNNQVIQKTWMFKYRGKQVVSTVTTMACFDKAHDVTRHQFEATFPTALFPNQNNRTLLMSRFDQFTNEANEIHRRYRKTFISSRIQKVVSECTVENNEVCDSISKDTCNVGICDDVFKYSRVPSHESKTRVIDMECIAENPNSYRSVAIVLDTLLEHLQREKDDRKYIPVYMNGAPFSICIKLVRNTYLCGICNETVSSDDTEVHIAKKHSSEAASVKWTRKYKKILIRPGSGHVEMTMVKCVMSTFWIPFVKPIAALFGYNSESQLEYCRKAFDHHKSWNMLMVIFAAYADELIYPYVKYALLNNERPSFEGYSKWESETAKHNLTYKLAADFIFTTLNSLHLFRSAIRNCNHDEALLFRHKTTSLLYGCHNTKYHEILCYDTSYLLSLDNETRRAVTVESTRRIDGDVGEGYDFLLENRNKLYKSFLPTDSAPSFEQWLQVTKASTELEEMRSIACSRLELTISASKQRPRKFEEEIYEARKFIRQSTVFTEGQSNLVSIGKENVAMDECMLNYIHTAEANRRSYYKAFVCNEKVHMPMLNVTQDVSDITTRSLEDIKMILLKKIGLLREPFYSFFKNSYKKNIQKDDAIDLYKAVMKQIAYQTTADYETLLSEAFSNYATM